MGNDLIVGDVDITGSFLLLKMTPLCKQGRGKVLLIVAQETHESRAHHEDSPSSHRITSPLFTEVSSSTDLQS